MMATGATGVRAGGSTSDWTQPEENSSSTKADGAHTASCSSQWMTNSTSTMQTAITRTGSLTTCVYCTASATTWFMAKEGNNVRHEPSTARRTRDKSNTTEEPCAWKLASTVL